MQCLKQTVTCVLTDESTGVSIEATNQCFPEGSPAVCPRVTLGLPTGEGYHHCGPPIHAEVAAIAAAREKGMALEGATCRIYGHEYICTECVDALLDAGVTRFIIRGKEIHQLC